MRASSSGFPEDDAENPPPSVSAAENPERAEIAKPRDS